MVEKKNHTVSFTKIQRDDFNLQIGEENVFRDFFDSETPVARCLRILKKNKKTNSGVSE